MTGADIARAVLAIKRGDAPPWTTAGQTAVAWVFQIPVPDCLARLDEVEEAMGVMAYAGRKVAFDQLTLLADAIDERIEA